jgi:hypothetical protein
VTSRRLFANFGGTTTIHRPPRHFRMASSFDRTCQICKTVADRIRLRPIGRWRPARLHAVRTRLVVRGSPVNR